MSGGGGGEGKSRELDRTPTWAVALVTVVIIIISILIEKILHYVTETFHKRKKHALVEAVEKIKAELMILGFISLVLTFGQSYIANICLPADVVNNMWPCEVEHTAGTDLGTGAGAGHGPPLATGASHGLAPAPTIDTDTGHSHSPPVPTDVEHQHRRLLMAGHRMLSGGSSSSACPHGEVPLISSNGLHQLHVFIFFLAVFHVYYSSITMILGRLKIRGWKEWETQIEKEIAESNDPTRFRLTHETSFVRSHTSPWMQNAFLFYLGCFFRHLLYSVQKADYSTLRHGFVSVHLSPGMKFNFQKYIKRSLEDDFKVVVGIPHYLWLTAVIYQLLNLKGGLVMFWLGLLPALIIFSVGTKLQSIITQMAVEIQEKHAVIQGIPLVQVSDKHFWFGKPQLVLQLIHLALFQNSFEITHFVWIWYEFGLHSCYHKDFPLAVLRIFIGIILQFICSYITLPLYALVTQMGSHMKKSIFDEQTSKALMSWHEKIKAKGGVAVPAPPHMKKQAGSSPDDPPHESSAGIEVTDGTTQVELSGDLQ